MPKNPLKAFGSWEVDDNGFLGLEGRLQPRRQEVRQTLVAAGLVTGGKSLGRSMRPGRRTVLLLLFRVGEPGRCPSGEAVRQGRERHKGPVEGEQGSEAQKYSVALEMRENFSLVERRGWDM